MELNYTPLEVDSEYFLDASVEYGEMNSAHSTVLTMYGDRKAIVDAILPVNSLGSHLNTRLASCDRLATLARAIIEDLPPIRRSAIFLLGTLHMTYKVNEHAIYLSRSLYTDHLTGGNLWPFKRPPQKKLTKKQIQRLNSVSFIRKKVKEYSDETPRLRDLCCSFLKEALPHLTEVKIDEIFAEVNKIFDDQQKLRDHRMALQPPLRSTTQAPVKASKAAGQAARKVARRAMVAATGLVGLATASAFASGTPITLEGKECSLIVQKIGKLHALGHGNVSVTVTSKSGEKLADLCVYIDKTPALDHLSAFALYAMAGEERKIIETANVIRVHPAGVNSPLIRQEKNFSITADRLAGYHRQMDLEIEYWNSTKEIWNRETSVYMFGRSERLMRKFGNFYRDNAPVVVEQEREWVD